MVALARFEHAAASLPGDKAVPAGTICGRAQSDQSSQSSTTPTIQFDDLRAPESVTAPSNAVNQDDLG
jgi:negative regulator of sigma E activity